MKNFISQARKLAYDEVEKTTMPLKLHIDLATEVGVKLAKELGANGQIVEAGTLLMDCLIGQALKENRLVDHVQMSLDKTNELLAQSSLTAEQKENIHHCVLEHHGVEKFYSIESEICANADCYRFISIKGFMYATRYLRKMPFNDLVELLSKKVDEKWSVLTINACKKELAPQHEVIKTYLRYLLN